MPISLALCGTWNTSARFTGLTYQALPSEHGGVVHLFGDESDDP